MTYKVTPHDHTSAICEPQTSILVTASQEFPKKQLNYKYIYRTDHVYKIIHYATFHNFSPFIVELQLSISVFKHVNNVNKK